MLLIGLLKAGRDPGTSYKRHSFPPWLLAARSHRTAHQVLSSATLLSTPGSNFLSRYQSPFLSISPPLLHLPISLSRSILFTPFLSLHHFTRVLRNTRKTHTIARIRSLTCAKTKWMREVQEMGEGVREMVDGKKEQTRDEEERGRERYKRQGGREAGRIALITRSWRKKKEV